MTEKIVEMSKEGEQTEHHVSLDNVRQQILRYENEIKTYLDKLEASVDSYRFSVEKHDSAITVDVSFRATIHPKSSPSGKSS